MDKIIFGYDLPSDIPGKTWKEKNLEMKHNIPLWSLVEIDNDDSPNKGIRLLVCGYTRDCDGTPLYDLTWDKERFEEFEGISNIIVSIRNFGEESLKVIRYGENKKLS